MWAHRFTILTVVATFFLLIVGGLVHGTGASLACPDWPTCYGTLMPPMQGLIFFEHGHRLVATGVGILTIISAVLIFREYRQRPALWKMGLGALALVIFQGVLGGVTVIYRLPPAVSTMHLGTAMLYFSLMIVLAFLTHPEPARGGPYPGDIRRIIVISTVAVYVQIVLGAVVRHTNSGLACMSFPHCGETAFPDAAVWIQMIHRLGALAVIVIMVKMVAAVMKSPATSAGIRRLTVISAVLLAVQVTLGILSVFSHLELTVVTAHMGVGALLLGVHVLLWMSARGRSASEMPQTVEAVKGVVSSTTV